MNLHSIVSGAISAVNPKITGAVQVATGNYTTSPDGTQVPAYITSPIIMDVQALSAREIQHLDSLNVQGILKGVWADGELHGVDRTAGTGGDVLTFSGATWLVVQVIEAWNGDWCHVAVQKQIA